MGASSSALTYGIDRATFRRLAPEHFSDGLFDELAEATVSFRGEGGDSAAGHKDFISKQSMMSFAHAVTDIFFSYDVSTPAAASAPSSDASRVLRLSSALTETGFMTKFPRTEDTKEDLAGYINMAAVVIIFVTADYCKDVEDETSRGNFEFSHMAHSKLPCHIIPVVLEPAYRSYDALPDVMKPYLDASMLVDCSAEDRVSVACADLVGKLHRALPVTAAEKIKALFQLWEPKSDGAISRCETLSNQDTAQQIQRMLDKILNGGDMNAWNDLTEMECNLAIAAEIYLRSRKDDDILKLRNTETATRLMGDLRSWLEDCASVSFSPRERALCCLVLGHCLVLGIGCHEDTGVGLIWLRVAAEAECALAQFDLAEHYRIGSVVPVNMEEATKWYHMAADHGDRRAQNSLGHCYQAGLGVPEDLTEAALWFRKAAQQGHASAQNSLGLCYQNGCGLPKSHMDAAYWFRKGAEQGNPEAQYNLAVCYGEGLGVIADADESMIWMQRAAAQGHEDALRAI